MSEMIERVANDILAVLSDPKLSTDYSDSAAAKSGDLADCLIDGSVNLRIVARAAIKAVRAQLAKDNPHFLDCQECAVHLEIDAALAPEKVT